MNNFIITMILAVFGMSVSVPAYGSGQPDLTFGENGRRILDLGVIDPELTGAETIPFDSITDHKNYIVLVGRVMEDIIDGKPVAGYYSGWIARVNADGVFDTTFAGVGARKLGRFERGYSFTEVLEQPDGKLLVAGMTRDVTLAGEPPIYDEGVPVVCRFTESGDLDAAFGAGGCRTLDTVAGRPALRGLPGTEQVFPGGALALDKNGRVLVGGSVTEKSPGDLRTFHPVDITPT